MREEWRLKKTSSPECLWTASSRGLTWLSNVGRSPEELETSLLGRPAPSHLPGHRKGRGGKLNGGPHAMTQMSLLPQRETHVRVGTSRDLLRLRFGDSNITNAFMCPAYQLRNISQPACVDISDFNSWFIYKI